MAGQLMHDHMSRVNPTHVGILIGAQPHASFLCYAGEAEDFILTPLEELAQQIAAGKLHVQVGKTFHLDDIVEAHRCMDGNKASGKIVVLT